MGLVNHYKYLFFFQRGDRLDTLESEKTHTFLISMLNIFVMEGKNGSFQNYDNIFSKIGENYEKIHA